MPGREQHSTAADSPNSAAGVTDGGERIGTGSAHAKVILLGEHAVVYGAPALAIPLPQLTVTVHVVQGPPPGDHDRGDVEDGGISFTAAEAAPPVAADTARGLRDLVVRFRDLAGITGDDARAPLSLLVDCMIPPGRGLGASAACAQAVVLALCDLYDHDLDRLTVFDLVQTAETAAHGRASGVDAHAIGSTRPVHYRAGVATEFDYGFDGVFVIADSGVCGRTKDAIEHVRRRFADDPATESRFMSAVGALARDGLRDITVGSAEDFGAKMTDNHAALRDLGLSTAGIDALVAAALAAGGVGAKISGGGLGGCMIALTTDPAQADTVAAALRAAGAVNTWLAPVGRFVGA